MLVPERHYFKQFLLAIAKKFNGGRRRDVLHSCHLQLHFFSVMVSKSRTNFSTFKYDSAKRKLSCVSNAREFGISVEVRS